jgi:hypothetical protein
MCRLAAVPGISFINMKQFYLPGIFWLCLLISSCRQRDRPVAFYYWKTTFSLSPLEQRILKDNGVKTLYVRYFDVDFAPGDTCPAPVSPIHTDTLLPGYHIIPVVYIKNRTFERLDTAGVVTLVRRIFGLVTQMSRSWNGNMGEVQFDCDWTEKTKDNYFLFLQQYKGLSKGMISATIRLHQVKYKKETGIPPVDYGALMYYNMGSVNSGSQNSIYERAIANRYNSFIRHYPLTLDIALPIFSWGHIIRGGRVVQLLNKMNEGHFKNDTNFCRTADGRFLVKHAGFKSGYYFQEDDVVKTEHVSADDLIDMSEQVNRYSNHRIRNLVFYDLDSINLMHYDENIYQKVLDRID